MTDYSSKTVYIASPYTGHDPLDSVGRQVDVGNILLDEGFNPFVPLLWHHLGIERDHAF